MGFGSYFRNVGRAIAGRAPAASSPDLTADPRKASPVGRSFAAAHVPGHQITDHLEELKHMTSWVYPAVQKLGEAWGNATVNVYDRSAEKAFRGRMVAKSAASDTPAEQRTPLPDHPAARRLRRPNPLKSGQAFLYQLACQLYLTGGYVIWEVRNQLGLPWELWVLPRGWLSYQQPTDRYPLGLWRVQPSRASGMWTGGPGGQYSTGFYLDVRDTIFGGWPDPLYPGEYKSPLAACAQIIDITEKADHATWNLLVKAPRPGMILSADASMTQEQVDQMAASVEANKAGVHNAGLWVVLHGVKPERTNLPLADIDSVNVREQGKKFVQSIFGVPSVLTGDLDGATYSGNAAAINCFAENSVQPGLTLFAGDLTHRWQRYWGEDFCVEISAKRTDDPEMDRRRADSLKDAAKSGGCTWNEWRAAEKLPPLPGLDEIQQPPPPGAVGPGIQHGADGRFAPGGGLAPALPSVTDDDLGDDGDVDLTPELSDSTRTGFKRPELQAAGGRGFSRNGTGGH